MNGYIKKSDAVDVIVKYPYNISGKTATAIKMIEGLPDADVVPRTEVEMFKIKFDILKSTVTHKEEKAYNKGYADAVGEIFDDIEKITNDYLINRKLSKRGLSLICKIGEPNLELQLAELKKKYTE